jgi:hypothetical protein
MAVSTYKQPPTRQHQLAPRHATTEATASSWQWLYKTGAVAALLSAAFIPLQVLVFILWPPPATAIEWFALFQDNPLIGLVDLDLLLVADNLLLIPILLSLYLLLRHANQSLMLPVTALGLLGIALFIASNPAVEMLLLSRGYAAAASEAQAALFLAAGEAMLAVWEGTAFQVAYVIGSAAGILIGIAMLRGSRFGKMLASMAILGNAVAFGYYLPGIGVYISVFSVLFLEIWYLLLARRLWQFGQTPAPEMN